MDFLIGSTPAQVDQNRLRPAMNRMAEPEVTVLLKKIKALSTVNQEIIDRIKAKKSVVTYKYSLASNLQSAQSPLNELPLFFREAKQEQDAQQLISSFKPNISQSPLTAVDDIFNDRLNYTCSSFQDIVRLNADIPRVAQKFDLLREEKAVPYVRQFLENLNTLQVALGQLDGMLRDQESSLQQLQTKYAEPVAKILREAAGKAAVLNGKAIKCWANLCNGVPLVLNSLIMQTHQIKFTAVEEWISASSGKRIGQYKLLWRGSRDGYTATAFHRLCDGIAPTLTLVTNKDNGKICGGYTPVAFDNHSGWISCDLQVGKSFLLSVSMDGVCTQHPNTNPQHSIYGGSSYGPDFGGGGGMYIVDNCNTQQCGSILGTDYTAATSGTPSGIDPQYALMGSERFLVGEIEVFQIELK